MATLYDTLVATYGNTIVTFLPDWMLEHPEFATAYLDEIIEAGGTANPMAAVSAIELLRQAPQYREMYDELFAGSRRDDGTLRLDESAYFVRIQGYRNSIGMVSPNLNTHIFDDEYANLIAGDVDAQEFETRVNALYTRVLSQGADIRNYYGDNFAINMTDEGILASLMSPTVGDAILLKQLTMAEIGGTAAEKAFDISSEFVTLLEQAGMDREEAQRQLGTAQQLLPVLGNLAARHGDKDDDFDITEFIGGSFLDDPEQVARIKRLQAQEASTCVGGAAVDIVRGRTGGVTGLLDV